VYSLPRTFKRRPAASEEAIVQVAKSLGLSLPDAYEGFLRTTNGGEGFIGDHYVIFWSAEELERLNRGHDVQKNVPGLLVFGTDGGGEAFAFDTRRLPWAVVLVPFVVMESSAIVPLAPSFEAFLRFLHENESLFSPKPRSLSAPRDDE
jgi:SMI1 / KNR4 family (SUKH-1)